MVDKSETESVDRAWTLIKEIGICMFVTHSGSNDALRARPMGVTAERDEHKLYMMADVRAYEDDEIKANQHVCCAFADKSSNKYVSVTGNASVSRDKALIKKIWSPASKVWFDSPEDPNICVLTVTPSDAEFWDGDGKVVSMVKMASAAVSGKRPDLGDVKKVKI